MSKIIFGTAALAFATVAAAQNLYLPSQPAPIAAPVASAPSSEAVPAAEPAPAMSATRTALPRCSATVRDSCVQDERYASRKSTPGMRDNNALRSRGKRTRG